MSHLNIQHFDGPTRADPQGREQLHKLYPEFKTLMDVIMDMVLVVGSEIYMADLGYYQRLRPATKCNRAGAEVIHNDLRTRFPGRSAPAPTPAAPQL